MEIDPVLTRPAENVGGMWGLMIAVVSALLLIVFLIFAGYNNNSNTASSGSSTSTTASRITTPPSTTGFGSSSPQPITPAPSTPAPQRRRDNGLLFVFDHFDQLVLAPWAFKSAPVVVWCVIGLNSNEPHLRVANLATRTTHYPRTRDDLRSLHDAPHDCRSGSAVVCQQPPSRTADRKNNMPAKFVSRSGY